MGEALAPSQGLSFSEYRANGYEPKGTISHWGRAETMSTFAATMIGSESGRSVMARSFVPFRVGTLSEITGLGPDIARMFATYGAPRGLLDQTGVCAEGDDGLLVASIPTWDDDQQPPRRSLLRLQRHRASGRRARSAAHALENGHRGAAPDAVFDAKGAVLDARVDSRILGRALAVAKSFANDLDGKEDESAESLWQSLWEGGYGIARVVDTDGKRLFVLRRIRPEEAHRRLSPVEARVVQHAARGESLKLIAAELGGSVSTVHLHLQRGLAKLGLKDRVQLVGLFAGLRVDSKAGG